jgi:hypothetical protein
MRKAVRFMGILILLLLYFGLIPWVLTREYQRVTTTFGRYAPSGGDTLDYQPLAVNIARRHGYTITLYRSLSSYGFRVDTRNTRFLQREQDTDGMVSSVPEQDFYRAPGWPLLLAGIYTLFDVDARAARIALAVMVWLTSVGLAALGYVIARNRGLAAGAIVGMFYAILPEVLRSWTLEPLLTEIPAALWATLFALLLALYERRRGIGWMIAAALAYACLALTRSNYLLAVPFFMIYLLWRARSLVPPLIFAVIIGLPVAGWSLYASAQNGRFVPLSTQSDIAYTHFNNPDVITGVGPFRFARGGWSPGWIMSEDGTRLIALDWRYMRQPGSSGFSQALRFWRENLLQLPAMFYHKLNANFWSSDRLAPTFALGIAGLLFAVGLRHARRQRPAGRSLFMLQVGLLFVPFLAEVALGDEGYGLVLLGYLGLILIAMFRPYGHLVKPSFSLPLWFLCFAGGHFFTTLLFGDYRFDDHISPLLMLISLLTLTIVIESILPSSRRRRRMVQST